MTLILHSSVANNYANATIVTLGNIMHFRQAKSVIYKDVLKNPKGISVHRVPRVITTALRKYLQAECGLFLGTNQFLCITGLTKQK